MGFDLGAFGLGLLGGGLAEFMKWYQLREESPNWPVYAKTKGYWVLTGLMILIGGFFTTFYGLDTSQPLLPLNVGLSAPLILKGLAANAPALVSSRNLPDDEGRSKPSLMNFLAGK